jgi:hypothetical protein
MQVKQLFALAALALAGTAVLADEAPGTPLTRAEVIQSVLAARAAGTLMPAGQGEYPQSTPADTASTRTLSQARAEVLQARAEGTLRHAGEAAPEEQMAYERAHPSTSVLTRAEVKAEVLQARANGELVPAGEGEYPESAEATHVAHVAAPHQSVAARGAN